MKLKPIACVSLALILGVSSTAISRAKKGLNNDGVRVKKNGVKLTETTAQPPTIIVSCPDQIQIGPVNVPDGWLSLGSLPKNRFSITIDAATHSVLCEYTNQAVAFQSYYIARKIPAGYECKVPYPKDYRAICTMIPRARPRQ